MLKVSDGFHQEIKNGIELSEIGFTLPNHGYIKTKGIIRGVFKSEGDNYVCGVEFIDLTVSNIDKIYRYVVDMQRKVLKKLND